MDRVPSHEGIQHDVDTAPFCKFDETLVETANYLVDLDKYAHHLEDESRNLFGEIRDATIEARQYQPRCLQLERERTGPATPPNRPADQNRLKLPTFNCLRSKDHERPSEDAGDHRAGHTSSSIRTYENGPTHSTDLTYL
jgi:hypothetical protein